MPQLQLPIFPAGTTPLTAELAFDCQDGKVAYLNGYLPVFQHAQEDLAAFRLFTSQVVVNGTASQAEIAREFHVPPKTVKRYVKRLREGSSKSFFETPRRRSASVLKGEVKEQAQTLLDEGQAVPEVARKLGVLPDTLHKAIRAKRLHQPKTKRI
jgi:transposase-like protein